MPKYFHYTTLEHLIKIEKDGFLKLVESNVSLEKEHSGPDVVWLFSDILKSVPKMMYLPLMKGDSKNLQKAEWTGFMMSKAQVELEITLEKSEVTRADKFLKKHGANDKDVRTLEDAGGYKFTKQYVAINQIPVEKITNITTREDLMALIDGRLNKGEENAVESGNS
jgi:hypothetical protein